MIASQKPRRLLAPVVYGLALFAGMTSVGCQGEYGGQILPSPYYLTDDVQYYAPGPEFKLAREGAAMKQAAEEAEAIDGRR